jgi:zinc transport system substrate-binding protein
MIHRTVALLAMLILLLLQTGCGISPENGRLQVITSIVPFAYFVERIGGDHVAVSAMVPPGGNPHSYEPTPRQMTELSGALVTKVDQVARIWNQRDKSFNGEALERS